MADEHHGEKELAAFIRAGADRRPEQAFGDYYRGKSASCALGAAYEGMYRLPNEAGGVRPTKDLEWFFDCLEGSAGRHSASPRFSCTSTTNISGRGSASLPGLTRSRKF